MDLTERTQWSFMCVCPAELEAEVDRIFASHAEWMRRTHHRQGDKALLQYPIAEGPDDDGAVVYAMTEIYQSPAGPEDHAKQAHESWEDFPAWQTLIDKCEGPWVNNGVIEHSLW